MFSFCIFEAQNEVELNGFSWQALPKPMKELKTLKRWRILLEIVLCEHQSETFRVWLPKKKKKKIRNRQGILKKLIKQIKIEHIFM